MTGVVERLAALRERRGADAWRRCEAVRRLVVVCASSRGGSSLFGEVLRGLPGLLHTSAEINPHFVIPTLDRFHVDLLADPAPVVAREPGLRILQTELGLDIGRPGVGAAEADHVAWRLMMQWPHEPIDPDAVKRWVAEAVMQVGDASREKTFLAVLQRARHTHPSLNPLAYDLDDRAVARWFPEATPPVPPPLIPVVEMAPFIVPRAWISASDADLAELPVVLVTPRNAFRVPLLCAAFPNAEVRVIHLVRNPAASVNGLIDGWHHHGFFSTPVDVPLRIAGYTDCYPSWGKQWWCYDLPPGWRGWTTVSLPQVCGFQWAASHCATVEAVCRLGLDCYRVHFEDLVSSPASRRRVLGGLAQWLGADAEAFAGAANRALPVVMSTAPPRPARWRNRGDELAPVLEDPHVQALARELGYQADPSTWP
jgi:hypothetical protein